MLVKTRITRMSLGQTNVGENVKKLELSYIAGGQGMGHEKWCSCGGKVWQFLRKSNTELLYDPAIPLIGIHPEELKIGV